MTHRADQVIEAVKAAIEAVAPSKFKVYTHRRESLGEEADELPAFTVDFGEDVPVAGDGSSHLDGTIESLLTVNVTGVATSDNEVALRRLLLEMRALTHRAFGANPTLGLAFVTDTHYGGANPPETDVSGETYVGELTCPWGVMYEMNRTTPE